LHGHRQIEVAARLSLYSNGQISGVALESGSFEFTVEASVD
jgi:hypothetical protein